MPRYVNNFQSSKPDEQVMAIAHQYLISQGFSLSGYKGEELWKKGDGFFAAPQMVKITSNNSQVQIEAFIVTYLIPGVGGKERDLTGVYGIAIKQALQKKVNDLHNMLI